MGDRDSSRQVFAGHALPIGNVIAGERHGILCLRQLNLIDYDSIMAKSYLAASEIEFPHAAEPIVIERGRSFPILRKTFVPLVERFGVMEPQDGFVRLTPIRLNL